METTKHPKKVIFFSETIFSDRICNQILKNSNNTDIEIVSSEKVSEFENILKDKNKSYLYRARVIIARLLVELMRYIAPNKADVNGFSALQHFYFSEVDFPFNT